MPNVTPKDATRPGPLMHWLTVTVYDKDARTLASCQATDLKTAKRQCLYFTDIYRKGVRFEVTDDSGKLLHCEDMREDEPAPPYWEQVRTWLQL